MDKKFKAGSYKQQFQYKCFSPNPVDIGYKWRDPAIDLLLENANRNLGELNAYSMLVPDVNFFIRMHVFKEATASSRIEGTKTEMDDALLPREEVDPERRDDWQEVQNYTQAMNHAIAQLQTVPLSVRLLKETHKILLSDARGKHKSPGEIRTTQNWIGGSGPTDAFFIPPIAVEVPELMGDLERFWHNRQIQMPHLVRIAFSHYQFETIHPFQDGNGRIGRLLITLYLVAQGILKRPTLYLSDFFERNKGAYYDALTVVRTSDDMDHWVKFFLNGVAETAQKGKETFEKIVDLRHRSEDRIMTLGKRAKSGKELLKYLFSNPILNAKEAGRVLNLSHPPTNALLAEFIRHGILSEVTGYKRNRMFAFTEYLNLFKR